ncbi:MAG: DUF2723 domain-containing protein [Caldilineales bacterium]|nr:DUF2723 domain-containing protein [Caldilineales bacterium]MDW8316220.1 DUF2723 domain-containing protein [Anaerolineae bacterium]
MADATWRRGVSDVIGRWWAAGVVFSAALAVYLASAAPGLTWAHDSADGGELIAAVAVRGVPHPPGYPTYLLLAQPFVALPLGNLAQRGALFSAVAGAAAAALLAAALRQAPPDHWQAGLGPGRERRADAASPSSLPALAAGLALAFSPPLWSQATVVEVYALHAALAAGLIWALSRWRLTGGLGWLALSGLLFGLALGNHLTIVWLLPMLGVWAVGGAAGWPRRRLWLAGGGGLALGLSVYLYLPLAAAARPPINWGDPRSWEGFRWLVTAELYRPNAFALPADQVLPRLTAAAAGLWQGLLPWGALLAAAGLAGLAHRQPALAAAGALSALLSLAWAIGYNTADSLWSLLAAWVLVGWWAGLGLAWTWQRASGRGRVGRWAGIGLCLLVAAAPLALHWPRQDLRRDRQAEQFIGHILTAAEPDAVVVAAGDRALFSLWYARYGQGRRPDLIPLSRDLWGQPGYRSTVGHTHPGLAGESPPSEWPALLAHVLPQRPVYLASTGLEAPTPDALGLPADARYALEPLPDPARPEAPPFLWRLRAP